MKMLIVEVRDGYGGIFRQFVNPEKVRLFAHKRNGEFIVFDNGDAIEVATPASDLARQWSDCVATQSTGKRKDSILPFKQGK